MPYDLTQPKKTMACVLQSSDRNDLSEPKALGTVINDMKIKKITLYDDKDWTAGACPATLKGKQGYVFMPTSDEHMKIVKDGAALGQAKFVWAFKYNGKEAMLSPIRSRSLHIQTGHRIGPPEVGCSLGLPCRPMRNGIQLASRDSSGEQACRPQKHGFEWGAGLPAAPRKTDSSGEQACRHQKTCTIC